MIVKTLSLFVFCLMSLFQMGQQAQSKGFKLKKTPQIPMDTLPTSFAVRSQDDILVLQHSTPNSTQFFVYTDSTFKTILHNYNYTERNVISVDYSGSGIYTVEDKVIEKYPFLGVTEIPITDYEVYNMISLDDKTKLVPILKSVNGVTTGCPTIRVIKPFLNKTTDIQYDDGQNCQTTFPGELTDLQNGMIALRTSKKIYILQKKNISHVIQTISVRDYLKSQCSGLGHFHNPQTNFSMISLQTVYSENYIFIWNHQEQKYKFQGSQFDNYGPGCKFYDQNTCLTFLKNRFVKNENIHHQKVNHSYHQNTQNPLENLTLIAVSNDSLKLAGFDPKNYEIVIINVATQPINFTTLKRISLQNETYKCIKQIKFVRSDNQLLVSAENCQQNPKKLSNICKVNIQNELYNCVGLNESQPSYNISSMAIFHSLFQKSVSRFVSVKWKFSSNLFTLKCLLTEDNLNLDTETRTFQIQEPVVDVKLLYKNNSKERFMLQILTESQKTISKIFELMDDGKKVFIVEIPQKVSTLFPFYQTVVFNDYLVTLVNYKGQYNKCVLQFYNWQLEQKGENSTVFEEGQCSNINKNYRLLVLDNFNHLMVQRLFYFNNIYLVDFYRYKVQQDLTLSISKRSMFFKSSYLDGYLPEIPFALENGNMLVFYQHKDSGFDNMTYLQIYNVTVIPLFVAYLPIDGSYFGYTTFISSFLAYSSPLTNKNVPDQILAFTYNNVVYTIRNPTKQLMQIQRTNTPANYMIQMEKTLIYPDWNNYFNHSGRTFLAAQSELLIAFTAKNNQNLDDNLTGIVMETCQKHKGLKIWQLNQEHQQILSADISKNGYAFLLKSNHFKVIPYFYNDSAQHYDRAGTAAKFENIHTTTDDKILNTMKSSIDNLTYVIYRESEMIKDFQYIKIEEKFTKINSIAMENEGNLILLQTQNEILLVSRSQNKTERLSKNQTVVDMFVLAADSDELKQDNKWQKESQKLWEQKSSSIQYTILVRYENYTLLYSPDFKAYHKINEIKHDTIFAASQTQGFIAYVQVTENRTQVIRVRKIYSYGESPYVDNITLTPIPMSDGSGLFFQPTIKALQFSSKNTLCVITVSSEASSQEVLDSTHQEQEKTKTILRKDEGNLDLKSSSPIVMYMYSQEGCDPLTSYQENGQCKCLQNFSEVSFSSKDSKVIEIVSCQCINNFVLTEEQKCVCPIWQGFTYDMSNKLCICEDGQVIDAEDGRPVKVCSKNSWVWLYILISVIVVVVLALISWFVYKKCQDRRNQQPSQRGNYHML